MPRDSEVISDLRQVLETHVIVRRAQLGLSQRDLAEAAGISRVLVSQIERGVANFTVDTLERLAIALDVDPRALLEPIDLSPASDKEILRRMQSKAWVDADQFFAALDEARSRGKRAVASGYASKGSRRPRKTQG